MVVLLYLLYCKINGETEAFIYGRKGAHSLKDNEHKWFVSERVLVFLYFVTGVLYCHFFGLLKTSYLGVVEGLAAWLAFCFFRDGWYYLMRDRIGGTSNGWKHQSETDTSKFNFNYKQRRLRLYLAALVLIVGYALSPVI